jgi:hypothetical protein
MIKLDMPNLVILGLLVGIPVGAGYFGADLIHTLVEALVSLGRYMGY